MILSSGFMATKHDVVGVMFVYSVLIKELGKGNASGNGSGKPIRSCPLSMGAVCVRRGTRECICINTAEM